MFFQGLLFSLLSLSPQVLILLSVVHLFHAVGFLEIFFDCGWMSSLTLESLCIRIAIYLYVGVVLFIVAILVAGELVRHVLVVYNSSSLYHHWDFLFFLTEDSVLPVVPHLMLNAAAFQRSLLLLLGCVYMFVVCVVGGREQLLHLLNFPKCVCTINHSDLPQLSGHRATLKRSLPFVAVFFCVYLFQMLSMWQIFPNVSGPNLSPLCFSSAVINLQWKKMGVLSVIWVGDLGWDLETNTFALLAILIQFPKSLLISSCVAASHTDVSWWLSLSPLCGPIDLAVTWTLDMYKVDTWQVHKGWLWTDL